MQPDAPQLCFQKVRGQEKAKRLMTRCLGSGRISHAYIFRGPDGVGKQLFARGVAAALNCREGDGVSACGLCPSCRKFISGNQPDFVVVRPDKGAIKIAQIRETIRLLDYPPYESRYRVVLLEDVHTMRAEAANSLLKTLEEPPADNVLILTADGSRDLLATIGSRCQIIPFTSLTEEEAAEVILAAKPELEPREALLLARLAEGSPGRALLLHQNGMVELARKVVTVVSDPRIDGERDILQLLEAAAAMSELKERLLPFLGLLRLWLRDRLFALAGEEAGRGLAGFGTAGEAPPKHWSSETLFAKLRAVDRAERELQRNCNRTLVCEVLLFTLHDRS